MPSGTCLPFSPCSLSLCSLTHRMVRFVYLFLAADVKKFYLFPNAGGKLVAVFQNVGLQLGDVLTLQMVYHHKMQPMPFGMMPGSVEKGRSAVSNILS